MNDIFLGVPVQLGKNGIERVIELKLNGDEMALLNNSADHVRKVMEVFNAMELG